MGIFSEIMGRIFHTSAAAPVHPTVVAGAVAAGAPQVNLASVDVSAELTKMASRAGEKLNWQTSIVDLMKLLKLDSSLESRKQLAQELGYKLDKTDTASMNKWLIAEVMKKLAASGGKAPAELLH